MSPEKNMIMWNKDMFFMLFTEKYYNQTKEHGVEIDTQ